MSYKCWRILIAEEQFALQNRICRSLALLGYRTSTSVHSFRELLGVTQYSHEPFELFDLMLINGELMVAAGIDPVRFFQCVTQIRHAVIYDERRGQVRPETLYTSQCRQLSLIRNPDQQTLGSLLEQLDV